MSVALGLVTRLGACAAICLPDTVHICLRRLAALIKLPKEMKGALQL